MRDGLIVTTHLPQQVAEVCLGLTVHGVELYGFQAVFIRFILLIHIGE